MANYFQDPSQSFVPTPVYRPPFEAIQSTLMAKQQKYDAGLSNVRNIYNSVFNAPLTNGENSQVRAQFINDAENKLKNLSQVDLSLESNQNEARNVFAPFYKDQSILADMVYTKQQGNEVNNFNSFKPEKDSDEYADQRNLINIQTGIEKVKNAKRGDLSVYNVRKFVPYLNLEEDAIKKAKEAGFIVKTTVKDGVMIYETTNGEGAVGNWATFISGIVGERYNNQIADEALYAKEQGIKRQQYKYALNNNGAVLDEQNALRNQLTDMLTDSHKNNIQMADNWGKRQQQYKDELDKLINHPDLTIDEATNQANIEQVKQLIDVAEQQKNEYDKKVVDYAPGTKSFNETLQKALNNPDGYFYSEIKTQDILSVARSLAANEQKSMPVLNPAYKQAYEEKQDMITNNLEANKFELDKAKYLLDVDKEKWDREHPGQSRRTKSDGDGNNNTVVDPQNPNGLKFISADNTNPIEVTPKENYDNTLSATYQAGLTPMLNIDGIAGVLTKFGGINYDYLRTFFTAVQDDKPFEQFTPEEKKVAFRIKGIMKDSGISLDKFDRDSVAMAVHDYAAVNLKKQTLNSDNSEQFKTIATEFNNSETAFRKYMDLITARNIAFNKEAKSNKQYSTYFKEKDGKQILKNANDLASELPDLKLPGSPLSIGMNQEARNRLGANSPFFGSTMKGKELVSKFLDGTVTFSKGGGVVHQVNRGDNYEKAYISVNIKNGANHRVYEGSGEYNKLVSFTNKYGFDSKKYNTAVKDIEAKIYKTLPGATGEFGTVWEQVLSKKDGNGMDPGYRTIKQIGAPGNYGLIRVDGEVVDKNGEYSTILNALPSLKQEDIYKYFNNPIIHSKGVDGTPSIVLTLGPLSAEDEKTLKSTFGISDEVLSQMKKKGIELSINPETQSPALKNILGMGSGVYLNDQLRNGKTVHSSSISESVLGAQYDVIPNRTNNPDSVRVIGKFYKVDPATNIGKWETFKSDPISLSDKNPDELIAQIELLANQNFQNNLNSVNNFSLNNPAAAATVESRVAANKAFYKTKFGKEYEKPSNQ